MDELEKVDTLYTKICSLKMRLEKMLKLLLILLWYILTIILAK